MTAQLKGGVKLYIPLLKTWKTFSTFYVFEYSEFWNNYLYSVDVCETAVLVIDDIQNHL